MLLIVCRPLIYMTACFRYGYPEASRAQHASNKAGARLVSGGARRTIWTSPDLHQRYRKGRTQPDCASASGASGFIASDACRVAANFTGLSPFCAREVVCTHQSQRYKSCISSRCSRSRCRGPTTAPRCRPPGRRCLLFWGRGVKVLGADLDHALSQRIEECGVDLSGLMVSAHH